MKKVIRLTWVLLLGVWLLWGQTAIGEETGSLVGKPFTGYMQGVNFGNWLCQAPETREHYDSHVTFEDFQRAASWGLDHVRVPFSYRVLEDYNWEYLDKAVAWAKAAGLNVVLDMHVAPHYDFDRPGTDASTMFKNPDQQKEFAELWKEIALHFQDEGANVAFELLNEVANENYLIWNRIINRCVDAIREVSPERWIIIGGVYWNRIHTLQKLPKYDDPYIVYNFHPYEPYALTHQRCIWWQEQMDFNRHVTYPAALDDYYDYAAFMGEDTALLDQLNGVMDIRYLELYLQQAIEFRDERDIILYCGEFGCVDLAGEASRCAWHRDMIALFRRYGIACAVWNYRDSFGSRFFTLLDADRQVLYPAIIRMLGAKTEEEVLACWPDSENQ